MAAEVTKILKAINSLPREKQQKVLSTLIEQLRRQSEIGVIETIVCSYFNISIELVRSKTRKENIVFARHMIWFLARKYKGLSFPKIASLYGIRTHASIVHAYNRIINILKENGEEAIHVKKLIDLTLM